MLKLKEVPGIQSTLGNTALAQSPLWNMPAERITPVQIMAFCTRLALNGEEQSGDAIVQFIMSQLSSAVQQGAIGAAQALDYSAPRRAVFTSTELARGFGKCSDLGHSLIYKGITQVTAPLSS